MGLMSRKQVDDVQLRTKIVDVPEWRTNGMIPDEMPQVLVRGLMGNERDAYEQTLMQFSGTGKKTTQTYNLQGARARLAAMGLLNPDGTQMYDWRNKVDLNELGKKPADGLEKVIDAIRELSGIVTDDDQAKEQLEETAANFQNGQMIVSGSS